MLALVTAPPEYSPRVPPAALRIVGERLPGAPAGGVGGCAIKRDRHGRIQRRSSVRQEFMRRTGHPHGWAGHQIDHIWPLKRGGCDVVTNLQWLPTAAKQRKDRTE